MYVQDVLETQPPADLFSSDNDSEMLDIFRPTLAKYKQVTSPQSFYNNVFFFVGLTTLGTIIEIWLVGSLNWVSKRFNH